MSFLAIPALVSHLRTIPSNSPDREMAESHTLSIFRQTYENGKNRMPPVALGSTVLGLVHAYQLYGTTDSFNQKSQLAVVAGVLNIAILPWTLLAMAPTNNSIFAREEAWKEGDDERKVEVAKKQGGRSTESVLNRWVLLNFCRACFPLAGAVLAWYAY